MTDINGTITLAGPLVAKFGGSSMGGGRQIKLVTDIIVSMLKQDEKVLRRGSSEYRDLEDYPLLVVVSAMRGVTDKLQALCAMAESHDVHLSEVDAVCASLKDIHSECVEFLLGECDWAHLFEFRFEADLKVIRQCLQAVLIAKECPVVFKDIIMGFGEKWSAQILAKNLTVTLAKDAGNLRSFLGQFVDAREFLFLKESQGRTSQVRVDTERSTKALTALLSSEAIPNSGSVPSLRMSSRQDVKDSENPPLTRPDSTSGVSISSHGEADTFVSYRVPIITGFVASRADGGPTTLKRNGSDHSAAIVAALVHAQKLLIYTDVDAVYAADPRVVKNASKIDFLSYQEAAELAYFGAKVLHPMTMRPCVSHGIPIVLKNTFNPSYPGTLICHPSSPLAASRKAVGRKEEAPCKGFTLIGDLALIILEGSGMVGVQGVAARLFAAVHESGCNVIMITQASSEQSICFAVSEKDALKCKEAIHRAFYFEMHEEGEEADMACRVQGGVAILAAVGDGMVHCTGILGRLSSALSAAKINLIAVAQGSSERNITFVIDAENGKKGLAELHRAVYVA